MKRPELKPYKLTVGVTSLVDKSHSDRGKTWHNLATLPKSSPLAKRWRPFLN